jgi:hypothetical protein
VLRRIVAAFGAWLGRSWTDLSVLAGVVLAFIGVLLVHVPSALIALGVALTCFGWWAAKRMAHMPPRQQGAEQAQDEPER